MKKPGVFLIIVFVLGLFFPTFSQDDDSKTKMIPGGYFLWDYGNVVKGQDANLVERNNEWYYGLAGGLLLDVKPNDRMLHRASIEIASHYPYPRDPGANGGELMQNARWAVSLEEARTEILFGDVEEPMAAFNVGVFIHKTNPDTRHFGDYLFRSLIYPAIVFTNFNFPKTKLTGLHLHHRLGDSFYHDVFALIETEHYPFFDLSLAYTAGFNVANIFEVGAGVNLRSVVPVRPSLTNPDLASAVKLDNVFWDVPFDSTRDTDGNGTPDWNDGGTPYQVIFTSTDEVTDTTTGLTTMVTTHDTSIVNVTGQSSGQRGTIQSGSGGVFNPDGVIYSEIPHSYTIYNFSGTLLMGRAAVYPLALMGDDLPFKLSLYSEIGILGYKNYKHLYENRDERMPIMAGISFENPIIDVVAAELEVYKMEGPQSYQQRGKFNQPHPGSNAQSQGLDENLDDDFKWMFYMKKQFPGFSLVFLTGTDHLRRANNGGEVYNEILQDPSHWYWQMRFSTAVGK